VTIYKTSYDPQVRAVFFTFVENIGFGAITRTDELVAAQIMLDYDEAGQLAGLELLLPVDVSVLANDLISKVGADDLKAILDFIEHEPLKENPSGMKSARSRSTTGRWV
jgi:hypothetical protein